MSVATQLDHVAPDGPSRTLRYFLSSFWLPPAFFVPSAVIKST